MLFSARLASSFLILALIPVLFMAGRPSVQAVVAPPRVVEPSRVEAEVFQAVNRYRSSKGLAPLQLHERLVRAARKHSASMADGRILIGHDGFETRVKACGIRFWAAAENVGQNGGFHDPAAKAVSGWLQSRGHRFNIEGNYNLTGVGVVRDSDGGYYLTQIFLLSR